MLEFFKQPGIYECTLMFAAIIVYRIVTSIFRYRELQKLIHITIEACLTMVNTFYINLKASMLTSKDKILKSDAYSSEEKKIIKNEYADIDATIEIWYNESLEIIDKNIPKEFEIVINYKKKK